MNQLSVNPSRRTHFSTSYYINSKQYSEHKRKTSFFHGENDGLPNARQYRTEGMKFQICPVTYPRKPRKPTFQGLTGGHRMTRCDRIRPGAENTMEYAGNLPDSEVFSRPEFGSVGNSRIHGFGREWLVRKAGRMAYSMFSTPVHQLRLKSAKGGFQSQYGAIMTTVNTITTPKTGNTSPLARQQAIENCLSMALHFIRHGDSHQDIHAATGRAIRAASLLKQACAEFAIEGSAA